MNRSRKRCRVWGMAGRAPEVQHFFVPAEHEMGTNHVVDALMALAWNEAQRDALLHLLLC